MAAVALFALAAAFLLPRDQLIETDMLALLPVVEQQPLIQQASKRLTDAGRDRVVFLLRTPANPQARTNLTATSAEFVERLQHSGLFVVTQTRVIGEVARLFDYRFHLLTSDQALNIQTDPDRLVESALAGLYGLLGAFQASQLTTDPLGLHASYLTKLAPAGYDLLDGSTPTFTTGGQLHALHIVSTRAAGFDLTSQARLLEFIATNRRLAFHDNVELLVTGLPIFAAEGAKRAQSEVSLFGTISLVAILVLLIGVFRSPRPILLTALSIGSGVGCAFVTTLLVFDTIHVLTLVFGSSLIGISIDYALHYLCDAYRGSDWTPEAGLRRILPGITVALLTSVCAFSSFLITPFPGLQQIAVFSASGLLAAWLTVVLLYPSYAWPTLPRVEPRALRVIDGYLRQWARLPRAAALTLLAVAVPVIVLGLKDVRPNDDIRVLQSAPPKLLDEDARVRSLLPQQFDSQFFVVSGATSDAVLALEQRLSGLLDDAVASGSVSSYRALSQMYPDADTQRSNYQLVKSELYDSGRIDAFYDRIGLSTTDKASHLQAFAEAEAAQVAFGDWLDAMPDGWRTLWLGCEPKHCGAVVQLAGIRSMADLEAIAAGLEGVTLVDQVADLSQLLGRYREVATLLLAAVYGVILLALCWRFGVRAATAMISVPLAAVLIAMATIGWTGNLFSLFNLFALLLVVGISIDYAVFFHLNDGEHRTTTLAVSLSAGTTLMAFGMLAFSDTAVVNAFGLTLMAGIGSAFLLAPLASGSIRTKLFGKSHD